VFKFIFLSFALFSSFGLLGCSEDIARPVSEGSNRELAAELGADEYSMRSYVMVVLKTGPMDEKITDPSERAEIFAGHFSNMRALAEDKKLVLSGPFI